MVKVNLPSEILSQNDVNAIVRSINNSKVQYKQWNMERNLGYENGKYLDRWNYIFANIRDSFGHEPFITYHVSRGKLWEFIIIYNKQTKFMYLVIKEDTFKQLQGRRDNPCHYIRILNSKNFELQSEFQHDVIQKINLFSGFEDITDEYIEEDLERMISEIKDEVKGCFNILFKENMDGVYRITANLANYDLEIFKTIDLSKFITAGIDDILDTKDDIVVPQPKIPLGIRKDKIKNKDNKIINEKQEDKTNNKD